MKREGASSRGNGADEAHQRGGSRSRSRLEPAHTREFAGIGGKCRVAARVKEMAVEWRKAEQNPPRWPPRAAVRTGGDRQRPLVLPGDHAEAAPMETLSGAANPIGHLKRRPIWMGNREYLPLRQNLNQRATSARFQPHANASPQSGASFSPI